MAITNHLLRFVQLSELASGFTNSFISEMAGCFISRMAMQSSARWPFSVRQYAEIMRDAENQYLRFVGDAGGAA